MSHLDKKTTGAQDLGASLSAAITQALMQVEGMLPAKVVKVDRTTGRVSVQPMIQMGDTGGNKITRAIVPNIPIMTMGAGGIFASFPVQIDDLGFVFAADRDTSLFHQSQGGMDWPNTERIHHFGDGGFLPLKLFNFSIAGGVLADGFSLQTDDGGTFVTLKAGEVQITATKVKIVGDIEHTGDALQTGNTTRVGDTNTTGSFSMGGGSATITGDLNTVGAITNNGKDIGSGHAHSGVVPGSGNSGGVV